ncbi:MAG: LysR family transcriptional regulator [Kofleriaceae bacterium]|nr:LysR family transcriptional regulator [Myxococcales bacterium]MCB9559627.1 LysR family transcriptional regulator [Kofleriaceae bacterium]MCB9574932.1 LysR family transcriptional regulator [Kofleriaceae bacterium]
MTTDLNEIVVFVQVVEAGSLTAAARALRLPKSTVSRKLAQLEARLGARLLQRTTRKLGLTEAGDAYYDRVRGIVAEIDDADRAVADLQDAARGLLRVTAPIDVGGVLLGSLCAELLRDHPELQLELLLTDAVLDLVEHRIDVAIRFGPLPDSSLVARRLGPVRMVPCAAPGYLARRGRLTDPDQLADHDVVSFAPAPRMRTWSLTGKRGVVAVTPAPRLSADSLFTALAAVEAEAGIALLPDFALHEALAAGRIERVLTPWCGPISELFAVYPSSRNASRKLRMFLDTVAARLVPASVDTAPARAAAPAAAPRRRRS